MQNVRIEVEGISPLLLHNPAGSMKLSGTTATVKKVPTPEEEAEAGTYRLASNQLYLPSTSFRSCLVGGAKGRKFGRTAATSVVKGSVFVTTDETPLFSTSGEKLENYQIDTRRAVIQRSGILRSRPKLIDWSAEVEFEYDDNFITDQAVRDFLEIAGRTVGVGDFRPEKSGPFGRFRLV